MKKCKFSKTADNQLFICEIIAAGNYSISLKHPDTIYDTHAADPNHPLLKILPLFPNPLCLFPESLLLTKPMRVYKHKDYTTNH